MEKIKFPYPYEEIDVWCTHHKGTDSAEALLRLAASLYNGRDWPWPLSRCIRNLDGDRRVWAKALVDEYIERGETDALSDFGYKWWDHFADIKKGEKA